MAALVAWEVKHKENKESSSTSLSRGGGGLSRSGSESEITAKSLLEDCFPDTLKRHLPETPRKTPNAQTPSKKKPEEPATGIHQRKLFDDGETSGLDFGPYLLLRIAFIR